MALDIYKRGQQNTVLFSISDDLYDLLSDIIIEFKRVTGLFIDNYGDTRLTHQHAELLIKLLRGNIVAQQHNAYKEYQLFTDFLINSTKQELDLEMIGD